MIDVFLQNLGSRLFPIHVEIFHNMHLIQHNTLNTTIFTFFAFNERKGQYDIFSYKGQCFSEYKKHCLRACIFL